MAESVLVFGSATNILCALSFPYFMIPSFRIPCATKANTVPSAAAHGLQATEFGVHVEKPLNLTVVVGADTQLGGSIAKRLHASLKLTVNDLRSTQLLKNPTIASALQNVETLIFSPISSEREGWLSVFFPPFRREKNALQDQDVEIFLKVSVISVLAIYNIIQTLEA